MYVSTLMCQETHAVEERIVRQTRHESPSAAKMVYYVNRIFHKPLSDSYFGLKTVFVLIAELIQMKKYFLDYNFGDRLTVTAWNQIK